MARSAEDYKAFVEDFGIDEGDIEGAQWKEIGLPSAVANHATVLRHVLDQNLTVSYVELMNTSSLLASVKELLLFMKEQTSVFAYEGFAPAKFAAYLWSLHKSTPDGNDVFARDMAWCCLLVLMRGPSVIKETSLQKMDAKGRAICKALKAKYGIVEKVDSKGPFVVTLSRIAACFPTLVIELMTTCEQIDRPVQVQTLAARYGIAEFPAAFRTNIWFSIVPAKPGYKGIVSGLLIYCYAEGEVINQKQKDYRGKTKDEKMMQVIQYARAAMNSPIVHWDHREGLLTNKLQDLGMTSKKMEQWSNTFDAQYPNHIIARNDMVEIADI